MVHGGEIYDKNIELDYSVNLNPLGIPTAVIDAVRLAVEQIDRYPDTQLYSLRKRIAESEHTDYENIICSNGASEMLMTLLRYLQPGKILLTSPCFTGYYHAIRALGDSVQITEYSLNEKNDYQLDSDFLNCITKDIDLVILCNPNNPTGRAVDKDILQEILLKCEECGVKIIVDECFEPLSKRAESVVGYVNKFQGLYVIRAYTKLFSIPGIRFGYAYVPSKEVDNITRLLPEWNVSVIAGMAAYEAAGLVCGCDFVEQSVETVENERKYLEEQLACTGLVIYKSDANFLLIKSEYDLYNELLGYGIMVRDCSNIPGLDSSYIRIAVKDHISNEKLIGAIKQIIKR